MFTNHHKELGINILFFLSTLAVQMERVTPVYYNYFKRKSVSQVLLLSIRSGRNFKSLLSARMKCRWLFSKNAVAVHSLRFSVLVVCTLQCAEMLEISTSLVWRPPSGGDRIVVIIAFRQDDRRWVRVTNEFEQLLSSSVVVLG